MNYYYLAASLPMLSRDNPSLLSLEEFASLCAEHLSSADMALVSSIISDGSDYCATPVIEKWRAMETSLKNATAKLRASRLGRVASDYLRE